MARDAQHRAAEAERRAGAAEQRLATAEAALAQRQGLLQRAEVLRAAGFEEDALARLAEALAGAAQAEGRPTAEVVGAFLEAAADWRILAELRSQVAAARQQAEEAEAQAKARMAEVRVTEQAVRAARWLLGRKVSAAVVEAWQAVAAKVGLTEADLATGLARALEEHGSLEAARRAWTESVAKLRAEHRRLTAEVAALGAEREGLAAGIAAVQDAGIAKVREVADTASAEVRRAAAEFQRLAAEAAELREEVTFAQALRAGDPALWQRVQPGVWQGILARLEQWSETNLANPEVAIPDEVRRQAKGSPDYPALYGPFRVPLRGLVAWLQACLAAADADPERAVLAAGVRDGRGQP
jgi:chromosome segregation ATPase